MTQPSAGSIIAEYAKSGRSVCKKCQKNIGQGSVRLGLLVQSRFFDGVTPVWNHVDCCLKSSGKRLTSADAILGLHELRWKDQEKVRQRFEKSHWAKDTTVNGRRFGLQAEYAKSDRSTCRVCEKTVQKDQLRLAFLVDGPYGPVPAWHHAECFFEHHSPMVHVLEDFAQWASLTEEDQQRIRNHIQLSEGNAHADKQTPLVAVGEVEERLLHQQTDQVWEVKDVLEETLDTLNNKDRKSFLQQQLQSEGFKVEGRSEQTMFDLLADCLCFGKTETCKHCAQSRLVWDQLRQLYHCPIVQDWGACGFELELDAAQLSPFRLNQALFDEFDLDINPLKTRASEKSLMKRQKRCWDQVTLTLPASSALILQQQQMRKAKKRETIENQDDEPTSKKSKVTFMKGRAAVDPDSDLVDSHHVLEEDAIVYQAILASADVSTGRNTYYKLQCLEGDWVYNTQDSTKPHLTGTRREKRAGLGSASYYLFRSWGRVGTDIGDCRLERCSDRSELIARFRQLYAEKTGNEFGELFVKKPKMFYPMDLSVPAPSVLEKADQGRIVPGSKTKLHASVQRLLKMIFDVDAMRRAMIEMEVDLDKMPLGQISKNQISQAYGLLTQALTALDSPSTSKGQLMALTNQFFTLIPHDFGLSPAPLLDNVDMIRAKLDLLETMMEIEVAARIIELDNSPFADMDPFDVHYNALKNNIRPLDKASDTYQKILEYVRSTHGETHTEYSINVEEVFEIERQGETEQYIAHLKANSHLIHNRKLLWHGSRITNYVGILSQGLRIAPAEAPVTGYMFGKGIYFSDVVSKSANYCRSTPKEPTGLLVLSEVALGDMYERTSSEFVKQLPEKKQSLKGCGKWIPSSSADFPGIELKKQIAETEAGARQTRSRRKIQIMDSNSIECPLGPITKNNLKKSELMYNEYVVYREEQVHMRYLVMASFEFRKGKGRK